MNENSTVLILGANGLVGSAIYRRLNHFNKLLTPSHQELNLLNQNQTSEYFQRHQPEYVIIAAAKVGGIHANNAFRADFIFENLSMEVNVINAAFKQKVRRLLFLGSSCIYPRHCPQPMKEEHLLTGLLEPTNEPYAIAKIAGVKMVESFKRQYKLNWTSVMPTNLYGPNDNYHPEHSHVIPGLISRLSKAHHNKDQEFKIWGSGKPMREFLHVDDLADACITLMEISGDFPNLINVGSGKEISIGDLAIMISEIIQFKGQLIFDSSKPDGTMQKLLDSSKMITLGWKPKITLEKGLESVISEYLSSTNL